ncbi:hypothetical protein PS9374_03892 [Planomonospora sphaerica]|uniref:Uncharacterized protein n=1 Tax=Planomonospora sphaerica TaxID=161355 RepID=A0A171DFE7_9ACTN|nr:hypothetical protein [Planomonospora sphaerica]GAT68231.1 hypothetical protein PS9374_03892 [Planomonospora sphaerica]
MDPEATSTYEHRCRLLMRVAYPSRFREFRGDEVLGTLLDLAEPGQRSPALRDCLDVLRGGLVLRLREHPPLWPWLLSRLGDFRLPWRYRWWARDDIQGRFFIERRAAFQLSAYGLLFLALGEFPSHAFLVGMSIAYLIIAVPLRGSARRSLLARHEFHPDGTPYRQHPPESLLGSEAHASQPDRAGSRRPPGR